MNNRTREKMAVWEKRYHEHSQSGLTRKAYCEKNGLVKSTLDYWFTKISKIQQAEGLVELKMDKHTVFENSMKVIIGNKYQIELQGDFDPHVFCEAVKALETLT